MHGLDVNSDNNNNALNYIDYQLFLYINYRDQIRKIKQQ